MIGSAAFLDYPGLADAVMAEDSLTDSSLIVIYVKSTFGWLIDYFDLEHSGNGKIWCKSFGFRFADQWLDRLQSVCRFLTEYFALKGCF